MKISVKDLIYPQTINYLFKVRVLDGLEGLKILDLKNFILKNLKFNYPYINND